MTGGASLCRLTGFAWRAPLGARRWLILGALGASATGCGGKAESPSGGEGGATVSDDRGPRIGTGVAGAGGDRSAGMAAAAGTGSGGSAATPASACEGNTALTAGLRLCDNGLTRRATTEACSPPGLGTEAIPPEFFTAANRGEVFTCLRAAARPVLERIAAELGAPDGESPIGSFDAELARHGLLSVPVRRALRERALQDVVASCAAALLDPLRWGAGGPSPRRGSEVARPLEGSTTA